MLQSDENLLQNELLIDNLAQVHLKETAMWAKFLGIAGFIGSGFVVLIAIFAGSIFSSFTSRLPGNNAAAMAGGIGFIMAIYLIFAVILFFMSLFLYRFAAKLQVALKTNDQDSLNLSFLNLKIYYRFAGIITIVYLGFLFLAIIGVAIAAMATH